MNRIAAQQVKNLILHAIYVSEEWLKRGAGFCTNTMICNTVWREIFPPYSRHVDYIRCTCMQLLTVSPDHDTIIIRK